MACYILLRKNVEMGPFTFEELRAQTLTPKDLVWVEGQSRVWKYPTEIEALQPFVAAPEVLNETEMQQGAFITTSKGIFVGLPSQTSARPTYFSPIIRHKAPELETEFAQPLEKLQEPYYDHKGDKEQKAYRFSKTFSKPHNALWMGCVFAGLLFSALLIQKIVEAYDADAAGITAAAALPINSLGNAKDSPEENLVQNALTTEVVPIDTVTMKPVKREPAKLDLKKLVFLETNDYQVGLLGGIKNLRMLVINKSAFILDKVKFELQYLKPNGDVLKTENLILKSVGPKSRKSIAIKPNKRGVKVSYHITGIQSRQNSDDLFNL